MKITMRWPRLWPPGPLREELFPLPSLRLTWVPSVVLTVRTLQWFLVCVTVISLALIGWWWWESKDFDAIAERYESAASRTDALNRQLEAQLAHEGLTLPGDQIAMIQGKIAFANQLSEKRAFSWTRMLSELEETVPSHISIGSVKLDFQHSNIILDGLARNLQDLNGFVQTLQQHRAFQQAVLAKHEVHKRSDGGTAHLPTEMRGEKPDPGVEFTLAVGYHTAVLNAGVTP